MRIKRWETGLMVLILVVLGAGWLWGSGSWKHAVPKGLGIGDIPYANKMDRLTNLTLGSTNQKLTVGTSAPQWQDANVFAADAIAMGSTSMGTLTTAQARVLYHKITGASANMTLNAPNSAGYVYLVYNSSGYTCTVKKSGGTGVTIANNKIAGVIHDGTDYVRLTADASP